MDNLLFEIADWVDRMHNKTETKYIESLTKKIQELQDENQELNKELYELKKVRL